jgi:GT2 family glycosyltransferase
VSLAQSDTIFLSNPENCHLGDVLGKVEEFILPNRYLCFACAVFHTIHLFSEILLDPRKYISYAEAYMGWYQHSEYSNRLLHFASAITRKDWDRVGGFDSIYDNGCAYEDNDFVEKLISQGFEFVVFDNPYVAHIPHVRFGVAHLLEKNRKIFFNRWGHEPRERYEDINLTIYK